jgi:pimeloyl-ACP methyl ester carboxylesterase
VHGLSLSELSWRRDGHSGIGDRLAAELGHTCLYLRYNTGRHISTNGRQFAQLLQQVHDAWPVPVKTISLMGHSMGGLVIRSACWYAGQTGARWLAHLRRVICLGTPHHGSPLEQAGHAFETAARKIPFVEPLLLGKVRSAGIKDLRHGALLDEHWHEGISDPAASSAGTTVPLPPDVDHYFAAASLGRDDHDPIGQLLGDLLVRPDSAMGMHPDEMRRLKISPDHCRVFHEKNHFDLLTDTRVQEQLLEWFRG